VSTPVEVEPPRDPFARVCTAMCVVAVLGIALLVVPLPGPDRGQTVHDAAYLPELRGLLESTRAWLLDPERHAALEDLVDDIARSGAIPAESQALATNAIAHREAIGVERCAMALALALCGLAGALGLARRPVDMRPRSLLPERLAIAASLIACGFVVETASLLVTVPLIAFVAGAAVAFAIAANLTPLGDAHARLPIARSLALDGAVLALVLAPVAIHAFTHGVTAEMGWAQMLWHAVPAMGCMGVIATGLLGLATHVGVIIRARLVATQTELAVRAGT
jgi:hypothetical protein